MREKKRRSFFRNRVQHQVDENDNEVEKSIDFLRKKGLAKASKKFSREAKEGAIGIYINDNKFVKYKDIFLLINYNTTIFSKIKL